MSALAAAVTLADASGWSLTNLEMQKHLYLAQMRYLGETGNIIFPEDFQAWKLGPVVRTVYDRARSYGSHPVRSLFTDQQLPPGPARNSLLETYAELKSSSAWDLVAITHWEDGAWYKNYEPGSKFTLIPKRDIAEEYAKRLAATADTSAIAIT